MLESVTSKRKSPHWQNLDDAETEGRIRNENDKCGVVWASRKERCRKAVQRWEAALLCSPTDQCNRTVSESQRSVIPDGEGPS